MACEQAAGLQRRRLVRLPSVGKPMMKPQKGHAAASRLLPPQPLSAEGGTHRAARAAIKCGSPCRRLCTPRKWSAQSHDRLRSPPHPLTSACTRTPSAPSPGTPGTRRPAAASQRAWAGWARGSGWLGAHLIFRSLLCSPLLPRGSRRQPHAAQQQLPQPRRARRLLVEPAGAAHKAGGGPRRSG